MQILYLVNLKSTVDQWRDVSNRNSYASIVSLGSILIIDIMTQALSTNHSPQLLEKPLFAGADTGFLWQGWGSSPKTI